jgi:hypothetical protein
VCSSDLNRTRKDSHSVRGTSQIEPKHHSIRTHTGKAGSRHLQHWVIEDRNEEEEWI